MKTSKTLSKIFIVALVIFVSSCSSKHKNISKQPDGKLIQVRMVGLKQN